MNPLVRAALSEAIQGAVGNDLVFSIERNGVSYNAIRRGFETACDNAGIIFGQTKAGGVPGTICGTHLLRACVVKVCMNSTSCI